MSLTGYTNTGINQSMNGIVSITDGFGTTISDGSIFTDSIEVADFTASSINISGTATFEGLAVDGPSSLVGVVTFSTGLIANGITVSENALSYLANLTSNVQSQINSLISSVTALPTFSGSNIWTGTNKFNAVTTFSGNISANSNTVTPTNLGYVSGLTSNAQTQINSLSTSVSALPTLSGSNTWTNTNTFQSAHCKS